MVILISNFAQTHFCSSIDDPSLLTAIVFHIGRLHWDSSSILAFAMLKTHKTQQMVGQTELVHHLQFLNNSTTLHTTKINFTTSLASSEHYNSLASLAATWPISEYLRGEAHRWSAHDHGHLNHHYHHWSPSPSLTLLHQHHRRHHSHYHMWSSNHIDDILYSSTHPRSPPRTNDPTSPEQFHSNSITIPPHILHRKPPVIILGVKNSSNPEIHHTIPQQSIPTHQQHHTIITGPTLLEDYSYLHNKCPLLQTMLSLSPCGLSSAQVTWSMGTSPLLTHMSY